MLADGVDVSGKDSQMDYNVTPCDSAVLLHCSIEQKNDGACVVEVPC